MANHIYVQLSNFGTENQFGYQKHTDDIYNYPLHIHQFVELILVISGKLNVTVRGNEETAVSGQFILIMPFETHKYTSDTKSTFIIYTFSQTFIADFIKKSKGSYGDKAVFDASGQSLSIFTSRLVNDYDFSEYSIRSCLYSMLCDFEKQVKLSKKSTDNEIISRVISLINARSNEELPLKEIGKSIGYSANYLSHCIKSQIGMNYSYLLACIRCEQAKERLTESNVSILQIALECGFGSERTFHRQFKSITGKTPREYRTARQFQVVEKF